MSKSSIEWTTETWNPVTGCSRVSDGCQNCYAEKMTKRLEAMGQAKYTGLLNAQGRFNGTVKTWDDALQIPLKTRKPTTFFVNSMSDLFHANIPDEFIDKVFAVMALCPQHTFQVLTKRADRMRDFINTEDRDENVGDAICAFYGDTVMPTRWEMHQIRGDGMYDMWPLPNVWLGVSVENQKAADERIPLLLQTPAAIRWLSVEPLLEAVNLNHYIALDESNGDNSDFVEENGWGYDTYSGGFLGPNTYHDSCYAPEPGIHWVVVGGESGPGARPCNVDWIRQIVEQCKAAEVPVFVKQLGKHPQLWTNYGRVLNEVRLKDKKGGDINEFPEGLRIREFPK